MGRSGGINTKVEASNLKKADVQAKKDSVKAATAEKATAAQWGVGADNRGAAREGAAADKQAEKMRRDAEKKALLEEEDAASAGVAKPKKKGKKKDDVADLLMAGLSGGGSKKKAGAASSKASAGAEREKRYALRAAQQAATEKVAASKGIVMNNDHDLLRANTNALDDEEAGASGINNALGLLGVKDDAAAESKNVKVLYNAFLDKTMPGIRADNPGLKMSQYKERVQKLWDKSPENPRNQESQFPGRR